MATLRLTDAFVQTTGPDGRPRRRPGYGQGQQVVRIDEEVDRLLEGAELAKVTAKAEEALADADAVLLEDYNKGALAPALIRAAMAPPAARRAGRRRPEIPAVFDYAGATVFKPNRGSWRRRSARRWTSRIATRCPRRATGVDNLLLTLGAEGMVLVTKEGRRRTFRPGARGVRRVRRGRHGNGVGRRRPGRWGDGTRGGATGNIAAGIEVGKAGVATVSPDEVLAMHDERFDQIGRLRRRGVCRRGLAPRALNFGSRNTGRLAQLVRARASHARGRGFEPLIAHRL